MAAAVWWFYRDGATLLSGDAEAHLNIARRVVDSRTPGWAQLGTTWLPLPHLLMIPFVRDLRLWRTGLGGAIPSAVLMAGAATFLFAAVRRIFPTNAAWAAAAVFLLNPNTLYLGSIPMTEPTLYCSLFALLFFTVRYGDTRGVGALCGAGLAACAGSLARYEAWFLLPFAAAYVLAVSESGRFARVALFCALAGIGPAIWLAHNWFYFDDPLYFYRGPWSAMAIQGKLPYPGRGDWRVAVHYFYEAGKLIAGLPLLVLGAVGSAAALAARRAWWPVVFCALPIGFYVWSIHSSGTPLFVPGLEPHGYYNIRYAMAFLPLAALGVGALAHWSRSPIAAGVLILTALSPFAFYWRDRPITLAEAAHNSEGRREWTAEAVSFLRRAAGPNETFFTSFNDMTAIYRTLGVPLRMTLTGDNNPQFTMATSRPDLLLWEDWAVAMGGDAVQTTVDRARLRGPRYELSRRIMVKGQPVIEIYHRVFEYPPHENSLR